MTTIPTPPVLMVLEITLNFISSRLSTSGKSVQLIRTLGGQSHSSANHGQNPATGNGADQTSLQHRIDPTNDWHSLVDVCRQGSIALTFVSSDTMLRFRDSAAFVLSRNGVTRERRCSVSNAQLHTRTGPMGCAVSVTERETRNAFTTNGSKSILRRYRTCQFMQLY
uniref:(northern house mosquito) hypothetical protein n=1 Tax=Culex pipiens TaxID=7175 RepID=A0A8D8CP15_CULPI